MLRPWLACTKRCRSLCSGMALPSSSLATAIQCSSGLRLEGCHRAALQHIQAAWKHMDSGNPGVLGYLLCTLAFEESCPLSQEGCSRMLCCGLYIQIETVGDEPKRCIIPADPTHVSDGRNAPASQLLQHQWQPRRPVDIGVQHWRLVQRAQRIQSTISQRQQGPPRKVPEIVSLLRVGITAY